MRLSLLSDLHGYVPSPAAQAIVDKADAVCICGDIQSRAMHTFAWINAQKKPVVLVPGNHDWFLYDPAGAPSNWGFKPHVRVLIDSGCELDGVRFWGTPWSPIFFDWAFMLPPEGLREKYAKIPEGIDVLLTHSPPRIPRSRIDMVEGRRDHCGSAELAEAVLRARPRHLFCGHIHTGDHTPVRLGSTLCRNVSYLDEQYAPAFLPATLEL